MAPQAKSLRLPVALARGTFGVDNSFWLVYCRGMVWIGRRLMEMEAFGTPPCFSQTRTKMVHLSARMCGASLAPCDVIFTAPPRFSLLQQFFRVFLFNPWLAFSFILRPPSEVSTASGSPSGSSESPISPARKAWSRTFRRVPDNHGIRAFAAELWSFDAFCWGPVTWFTQRHVFDQICSSGM